MPKKPKLFIFLIFLFYIFNLLIGCCAAKNDLDQARELTQQSEDYYERAVSKYKILIHQEKHPEELYFALGKIYYSHGDFTQAIEAFRKTDALEAKKLLAISYYRLGDFTSALEIFNRNDIADDEYLYYHGLTCEKLNLFDQALKIYQKISSPDSSAQALGRINEIERQAKPQYIKEISPQISKILARAPSPENYPQAGALILLCDEKIEVSAENTQVAYLHYVIKILNERGKEAFAETGIDYDSTYEKVELEYARTIKPDGQVVEVGKRHIRDVSKYLNFPLYSNSRVYIISFPEITTGAVIEYKVKILRSQLLNKKDVVLSYPLETSEPIIAANFILRLPKEKTAHLKIINERYNNFQAQLTPRIQEKEGYRIYTWQFKDIPQIVPELNMPPQSQINPAILISTFDHWQEIYEWWWSLAKDKIKADDAIKNQIQQLIKNKNSQEEKIKAIYNFCAQEIRYVAVEYGQAGYEPHYASDIFKNKYGDCKDQAILLVTMLQEAGFSAWPVLIPTREHYAINEDFPTALFNHCIAAVQLQERIVFLDPTAETCSFDDLPADDQGRGVFICKEKTYAIQKTPLYPAEHNLIRQQCNLKVNRDETVTGQKVIFGTGIYNQAQRYWLVYTQPEMVELKLKEKIQELSIGAQLEKYKIENLQNLNQPVVLSYAFNGPEYFTCAGNLRLMPQLTALDTALVAKEERRYALDFSLLDIKETIFTVAIPNGFVVKYLPQSLTQDSPWLKLSVEYSQKDQEIIFRQRLELKEVVIPKEQYLKFKSFFQDLARRIKQRIVLERIK